MLWTLFEFAMGWHNAELETGATTGFVAILFPIIAIVWALRTIRREAGGVLTLRQALGTGLAISAVTAAIGIAFFWVYYTLINPQFLAAMRARGQAVDIASQLAAVAVGSFLLGAIISAVTGLILRQKGSEQ